VPTYAPEWRAPDHGLLIMLRVDRLVVAGLPPDVPNEIVPPFLLTVATHLVVASNNRQFHEALAASDFDGLEVGCICSIRHLRRHLSSHYSIQLGELVKVEVL
jgi:hypothetical protein